MHCTDNTNVRPNYTVLIRFPREGRWNGEMGGGGGGVGGGGINTCWEYYYLADLHTISIILIGI